MKHIKKHYLFVTVLMFSLHSNSAQLPEKSLSEEVDEAILIIRGKLISKSVKIEKLKQFTLNGKRQLVESFPKKGAPYTTYTFEVQEVLKGAFSNELIDVKMKGGCSQEINACMESSWGYNFDKGENAVLFLTYRRGSDIYITTRASGTAFSLKDDVLVRKIDEQHEETQLENNEIHKIIQSDENGSLELSPLLTLSRLKNVIAEKGGAK